jgi:predicted Co/Zn/Cd cation transporter (cation efflux family)
MSPELKEQLEVLVKLPDAEIPKVIVQLEQMLHFKAHKWDQFALSKRQYLIEIMYQVEKITDSLSVVESQQTADEIVAYVADKSPDIWHLIFSKFRLKFKPFNFQTRKN